MSTTSELIQSIRQDLEDKHKGGSQRDEVRVMQSMLNDKDYVVDVYGNDGVTGQYSPYADARSMLTTIISSTAKLPRDEAASLAEAHDFSKNEAGSMVNISKEFINTYATTTRRLPLGGREKSSVTLQGVHVPDSQTRYPKKVGINDDGTDRYESTLKPVPAHFKIKSQTPCPSWIKNK